ncbi:MAG: hypothetical protein JWP19_1344 [Rhodoglobus sp.]|nr:hypothetical protein [Rhodoglobus sp.]
MRKSITMILALSLAFTIVPAVAGCSVIKNVIDQQTGGDVNLGGKSVPTDFPTADVPLTDGEVIYGAGIKGTDGQVWNVTIKVADGSSFDSITSQLEAAGFTASEGIGGSTADGGTGTFQSDKYGVAVIVSKDGSNGFVANYTVTTLSASN